MEKIAKERQSTTSDISKTGEKHEASRRKNRSSYENREKAYGSRNLPKRAAACADFKDKSLRFSRKASLVESRREIIAEDENAAISLTADQVDRPNRRLIDFSFHDAYGNLMSVEMLEVGNLFVSGLILPLEKSVGRWYDRSVRCNNFGRVESWAISGYEEGIPIFWISTASADYDCIKPAVSYKMLHNIFFEKARASVEVYRKLSRACGGNPNLTVNELLAGVVHSMSHSKNTPNRRTIKEFIISHSAFIYNQLIGLDETSKKNDQIFKNLPVLLALLEKTKKQGSLVIPAITASSYLTNTGMEKTSKQSAAIAVNEADESDMSRKGKRTRERTSEKAPGACKRLKRDASCMDFNDKSLCFSGMAASVENRTEVIVQDEEAVISLTADKDEFRPNRRLTDFSFHDASGNIMSVEMLEVGNLFVSGLILPLEKSVGGWDNRGFRCNSFGRVESWAISGYEEGIPVFWISTASADYDCIKPAINYKMLHSLFFAKARASVEVYRKLSTNCGGNPNLTVDELLEGVAHSMSHDNIFPNKTTLKKFIMSHGEFIYNQLIGLDKTSQKGDLIFENLPVLLVLLDRSKTQGSLVIPEITASSCLTYTGTEKIAKQSAGVEGRKPDKSEMTKNGERIRLKDGEKAPGSWKMTKRDASYMDFKDKFLSFSGKKSLVQNQREGLVQDEEAAISLTADQDEFRPNRRLTDFAFHDASGNLEAVEMLEVGNLFVSGLILPLETSDGRWDDRGVRCNNFGRVESWAISGYDEGSPVFWISTASADYDCSKPAISYKMLYNLFFEKARASVEVYRKLSRTCGGNPNLSVEELLARVVHSMNHSKKFPNRITSKEFIISHGEFIYNQLLGLDDTSQNDNEIFENLPVLLALLDKTKKQGSLVIPKITASSLSLNTGTAKIAKQSDVVDFNKTDNSEMTRNGRKTRPHKGEKAPSPSKMLKRDVSCMDFYDKSICLYGKESPVENRREVIVQDEEAAISLTADQADFQPNRRLTDFAFHDTSGNLKSVEMLEVGNLFVSGLILPLQKSVGRREERGARCNDFGRVESWAISGYEEGSPIVWVSTATAHYDCIKPANTYKMLYNLFFEKARASVEVYKKLSRSCGGNPNLSVDELLARVTRSMGHSKNFRNMKSVKEFVISHGEFIYYQLTGLDDTSRKNDESFEKMPVLCALLDKSKKYGSLMIQETTASGNIMDNAPRIGGEHNNHSCNIGDEDNDLKMARLLQEQENWQSTKYNKMRRRVASLNKFYFMIDEDEVVNDYPLPAYYKPRDQENDEYIFDAINPDQRPRRMLHDWSLYNSDSRLIPLELLPMKNCYDNDITIFGSGIMTNEDAGGFYLDADIDQSSSVAENVGGIPIYMSEILEWTIEYESSMVLISVRTDISWYRLGKPSTQYAAWYKPVLKSARLAVALITMLNNQSRASRLSFADVIKRVSKFSQNNPAYISSCPIEVERYVVVHGQILLQQFAELPDKRISNCAFVSGLIEKIEERRHTKPLVKKKVAPKKETNSNPRASKNKAMQATTTGLINKIWEGCYNDFFPDVSKEAYLHKVEVNEEINNKHGENSEEDHEEVETEQTTIDKNIGKHIKPPCSSKDTKWDGQSIQKTSYGEALYKRAIVCDNLVNVGGSVLVENEDPDQLSSIYFVEFMFEKSDSRKMVHGRKMLRGSETFLGNIADQNEVFLTNDCLEFYLEDVKEIVGIEISSIPWGHEHRKANACKHKIECDRAKARKFDRFAMEYYCKSLYWPERGAFFRLPKDTMGLGSGVCHSCKRKENEREKEGFKLNLHGNGFTLEGTEYLVHDFLYVAHHHFATEDRNQDSFRKGGMKAYVVCQLLGIEVPKISTKVCPESIKVKVQRYFRPEDISEETAYCSDIREVYYSMQVVTVPVTGVKGKCDVRKKDDLAPLNTPVIFKHNFFCEKFYDPNLGTIKQLPPCWKTGFLKEWVDDGAAYTKKKDKCTEGEQADVVHKQTDSFRKTRLATLDIFSGCGGLSDGLQQSGVSIAKWAIEYEEPAGEAFKVNHPEALVFINNCNVILRAIMTVCGDADDCISTPEAAELAAELDENTIKNLPRPGQVDFINGGPPCQGFSGMNRFSQGYWSQVQCQMILTLLSFADYFRPRFFLLENVRNFTSFDKGQTFRLTLASLLQMGYQVRFGVLQAGAYGLSQSRKRLFIWAASPEETLPEWPEPMHVFPGPEIKVKLAGNSQYVAVPSTANGAPFRAITVRDTIGDLPAVGNGASETTLEYTNEPVSWFQKKIRGDMLVLTDHITKAMNEVNLIRCQRIPKQPGSDWRDLPKEKVRLSNGQVVDLIPRCLPNTAKRHNQWKGLFGRLDWEGNFPTCVTDPHPMGMVGKCFHPDQDRIITVRDCARSQGFSDSYKFVGDIHHKHRQIGNAVPPPLAYALGMKLKEALELEMKASS